jgi:hypothetical protein
LANLFIRRALANPLSSLASLFSSSLLPFKGTSWAAIALPMSSSGFLRCSPAAPAQLQHHFFKAEIILSYAAFRPSMSGTRLIQMARNLSRGGALAPTTSHRPLDDTNDALKSPTTVLLPAATPTILHMTHVHPALPCCSMAFTSVIPEGSQVAPPLSEAALVV